MNLAESTDAPAALKKSQTHARISWLVGVSSVALLGMTFGITKYISPREEVDALKNAISARLEEAMRVLSEEEVDIEMLEEQICHDIGILRDQLAQRIPICCDECERSDSYVLASIFGDKPLSADKLHSASSNLSPSVHAHVQSIAKVLAECPELAPDILTILHDHLKQCNDRRSMLCYIIPKTDDDLSDATFVRNLATDFLRLQETNIASRSQENKLVSSE